MSGILKRQLLSAQQTTALVAANDGFEPFAFLETGSRNHVFASCAKWDVGRSISRLPIPLRPCI